MNENIDLTKILENCPKRTEFWSDDYGIVRFDSIIIGADTPIRVTRPDEYCSRYTKEGWHCKEMPGSCLLWPSRDCRDWSKFTAPWLKKERFDPKILKPFDRVICKNGLDKWHCDFFSSYMHEDICPYVCISGSYMYCIPYNDDTKHLVGTTDEAPEYYRYWED